MGTWGTGIFSDDTACDVRESFRDLIADGLTPEQATKKIKADFIVARKSDVFGQNRIVWLALAATQWKLGRLLDRVKSEALRIIDSGEDLEAWREESSARQRKRAAVLQRLREQLLSPQPKPRQIRLPYASRTDWEPGHLVAYRLLSGRWVCLRVLLIQEGKRDRHPIVELLDWVGDSPPTDPESISCIPKMHTGFYLSRSLFHYIDPPRRQFREAQWGRLARFLELVGDDQDTARSRWPADEDGKFALYELRANQRPSDRLIVIGREPYAREESSNGVCYFGGWAALDDYLVTTYGLS